MCCELVGLWSAVARGPSFPSDSGSFLGILSGLVFRSQLWNRKDAISLISASVTFRRWTLPTDQKLHSTLFHIASAVGPCVFTSTPVLSAEPFVDEFCLLNLITSFQMSPFLLVFSTQQELQNLRPQFFCLQ